MRVSSISFGSSPFLKLVDVLVMCARRPLAYTRPPLTVNAYRLHFLPDGVRLLIINENKVAGGNKGILSTRGFKRREERWKISHGLTHAPATLRIGEESGRGALEEHKEEADEERIIK
jgi:hypothetical protein